ncbi:MAG: M20/M25/M40 family metallo-hydrolase [Clostridia bacterium]|nr:M20/M25/M40 family metallo-hydrolase [Clostridia bacterium]
MLDSEQLEKIVALRHTLHACPERSGREVQTMAAIRAFLEQNTSLEIRDMGGWLLASHFEGDGLSAVGFRADMDALPADNDDGACHRCGHDGHSAMLCGLALVLEGRRVGRNVHLIFQAAEETGEGARRVIDSWPGLKALRAVYALHNIPGFPKGAVLMRRGCFSCASCGHIVHVTGRPAHAAYPGDGANPTELLCRLALAVPGMIDEILAGDSRLLMRTPIGLNVGGEDFGISAHEGRLRQTLRGHRKADIDALIQKIEARARADCREAGMTCDFEIRDAFPDPTSDDAAFDDAMRRFEAAGLPVKLLEEPMRWSEDFGWILKEVPGVYFGIGAGEDWPGLHTEGFEFDDGVIEAGVRAFEALL